MEFKDRLYESRRKKGFSQEELANACLVSRQAVSKWENGSSKPDSDNLMNIARCLDISVDFLLGYKGESGINKDVKDVLNAIPSTYEYKSKINIAGIPLVHIHTNRRNAIYLGKRKACVAKGIIAIGDIAIGVISIGILSIGLISIGLLGLGLMFSLGCLSISFFAVGAISLGYIAMGAVAIGVYSFGAIAIATNVAVGAITNAHDSFGANPFGKNTYKINSNSYQTYSKERFDMLINAVETTPMPGFFRSLLHVLIQK